MDVGMADISCHTGILQYKQKCGNEYSATMYHSPLHTVDHDTELELIINPLSTIKIS